MLRRKYTTTKSWAKRHPRRFLVYVLASIIGLIVLFQLFYPSNTLLPYSSIEHKNVGGMSKQNAIKVLDDSFNLSSVTVSINNSDTAFFKASPNELGITTSNAPRIEAISYPWFLRLMPSSLWWGHVFTEKVPSLEYQRNTDRLTDYMTTIFGDECSLEVRNASSKVEDSQIKTIEAFSGGTCSFEELNKKLSTVSPTVNGASISIMGTENKPTITTKQADELVATVEKAIKDGITINDGKNKRTIAKEILRTWIDFGVVENKLDYWFNSDRSASYLGERIASNVDKPVGTTTINLKDFAEASRDEGQSGVVFNRQKMLDSIKTALDKGEHEVAVEVDTIAPTVTYTRSYSPADAKLSALMKDFANSHPGTYSVSMRELSGQRRNASYRADAVTTTASTYKLFVAYSTLLRVESGEWQWSDYINGGRNLTQCFEDMIELSDNECAVALLRKVGVKPLTDEAHAIGATRTSFLKSDDIKSTAEDESLLLGLLASGQILKQQSSRDIWITALKNDVYRQGIPKGIPSAEVANKVGFLDGLLHDAAIVYSPKDTYVLVIMTNGSSWGNIAELAGQIETLRTK
jgi:beta-lactamase class A